MNTDTLTADQILKIKSPSRLFTPSTIKEHGKKLSMIWHPDRNRDPIASQVMAHINSLIKRAENGDWGNIFSFTDVKDGKQFTFRFRKKIPIDVGTMYIGEKLVVFEVDDSNDDLAISAFDAIRAIRYPTRMMEDSFKRFIPRDVKLFKTDAGYVITMYKGQDQICLRDIVDSGFDFQPGHISWIVTGLYNFILFMSKAQNRLFGGLSMDSIFVNTKMRGIHILGGWWYTTAFDKKMTALPSWAVGVIPSSTIKEKTPNVVIDLITLKALTISLLGDKGMVGSKLLTSLPRHKELVSFLRHSPQANPIEEYQKWVKVEERLSKLDIALTFNDVYNDE